MGKIGERLKILRNNRDISQRDLARSLNVSPSTIAQYETGKRTPDADTLNALAQYFDVSVDYLLGRTDNPQPIRQNPKYAWMEKLSPHLREALEKDIDKFAPYFRIVEKASLNDLNPMTLDAIVEAFLEAREIDEKAKRERIERERREREKQAQEKQDEDKRGSQE